MKENNLDFLPESYLNAFCKQAKLLNLEVDECNWFGRWSDKFDSYIKKEIEQNVHRTLLLVLSIEHICGKKVVEA